MLRDFIEANGLKAQILPARVRKPSGARCLLLQPSGDGLPIILLYSAKSRLDWEKVRKATGCTRQDIVEDERVRLVTGYAADCLPPISVYGVEVIVDTRTADFEELFVFTGKRQTLQIPVSEILESNEQVRIEDITKAD